MRMDFKRLLVTLRCSKCESNVEFDEEVILFPETGTVMCYACLGEEQDFEEELDFSDHDYSDLEDDDDEDEYNGN